MRSFMQLNHREEIQLTIYGEKVINVQIHT